MSRFGLAWPSSLEQAAKVCPDAVKTALYTLVN